MSLSTEITERFYDEKTGDLIEIEDGVVVNVDKSILSKQERLTINQERAQRLVTQQANIVTETPLVQPEMFDNQRPVSNSGPLVQPKMTFDGQPIANKTNQEVTGNPMPRMEW